MLNWHCLVIGFVLGLIPAVSYVMGWRSHKNVEQYGVIAPKLKQRFTRPSKIVVNTPEREYALEQEEQLISYAILARRMALTTNLAQNYVINLIEKGVPISKRYADGKVYITLDEQFKALQTRKNLIGVRPRTI